MKCYIVCSSSFNLNITKRNKLISAETITLSNYRRDPLNKELNPRLNNKTTHKIKDTTLEEVVYVQEKPIKKNMGQENFTGKGSL